MLSVEMPIFYKAISGGASFLSLLLGTYVLFKDYKGLINRLFFLMCLSLALPGVGVLIGSSLGNLNLIEKATFAYRIITIATAFEGTFYLHTCLVLCKKEKFLKNKLFLFFLYLPSVLVSIFALSNSFHIHSLKGLSGMMTHLSFPETFLLSYPIYLLTGLVFLIKKFFSLESKKEKTRIQLFVIGSLIPIIVNFAIILFFPSIPNIEVIFSVTITLGMAVAAYGIVYQKLFVDYREILEIIFGTLTELVIVTDKEGLILLANDASLSKLNLKREELIDTPIDKILEGGETKERELLKGLKPDKPKEETIYFKTRNEEKIPFSTNISLKKDEIIFVGKDIREFIDYEKKLEQEVKEKTKELEEAKSVLEIKVKARTQELEELARNLDEKVKERTKELQNRVDELERFHKLTIGRELKMVELKREIERLKGESGKK